MAWSRVQSKGGTAASAANLTVTLTSAPTTGNKIIVIATDARTGTAANITSVADGNAVGLTAMVTPFENTTGLSYTGVFAYDVPASPSTSFKITPASGTTEISGLVMEISGLLAGNTTAMIDGTPGTSTGSATPTGSPTYTSSASNEFLLTAFGDFGNTATCTAPSGYTLDANAINASGNCNACGAYKNSTGGSETSSWTYTPTTGDQWEVATVAFKLAAGGTTATPTPIVKTRSFLRKGVAWFRKTPPVFTAPTQKPLVRTFVRHNRGQIQVLRKAPVTGPATQQPIVHTFARRNRGSRLVLHELPIAYPPGPPIISTFRRRNKGSAKVTHQLPIAYPPGPPIVHSFLRRNKGQAQVLHLPPVFTAPNQKPIVRSFIRRNRGAAHLQTFPPPQQTPSQRPIVRSFLRRNRGSQQVLHQLPVFTAPTQTPIIRDQQQPVSRRRRFWQILRGPSAFVPPPPVEQIVFFSAVIPDHRWYAYPANPRWTSVITPPPDRSLTVTPALVLEAELVVERWATGPEALRWTATVSAPRWEAEVTAVA